MRKIIAIFLLFSTILFAVSAYESCAGSDCDQSLSQSSSKNCQQCFQCHPSHFVINSFVFSLKDKMKINTINYYVISLIENNWHPFIFRPPIS
jgi:hypothetical protein